MSETKKSSVLTTVLTTACLAAGWFYRTGKMEAFWAFLPCLFLGAFFAEKLGSLIENSEWRQQLAADAKARCELEVAEDNSKFIKEQGIEKEMSKATRKQAGEGSTAADVGESPTGKRRTKKDK
eukprot:CAMPEP_0182898454 /NCGR_PEP_ID=MMETSP0034_2-20130328/27493_1 /TAXON_ID=156128 /ORGANISM="Nephroselmis pyriformis, Strain CCMP717" /LENGTH=123 /DNA_ID=CAMNT_0025032427 /DNA_START=57 /DNA_END=428 /DNA_ORIENTATION=-